MQRPIRTSSQILLMADSVPAATKYVLRSIQEYCVAQNLVLPHVWIMSRQAQAQTEGMSWIMTPPPAGGSKDFQYLSALKFAMQHIARHNAGAVEVNPLPCFTLSKGVGPVLPVARYRDQRDHCTTCRSDGIKSLTLRALNRAGHTHYEYDLGSPFVAHSQQLVAMALGMQIPHAVETYYNNTHGIQPGDFIDSMRLIAEQRFMNVTPSQLNEALAHTALVAFTQNGWNRWVSDWCESRWPNPSKYELGDPPIEEGANQ